MSDTSLTPKIKIMEKISKKQVIIAIVAGIVGLFASIKEILVSKCISCFLIDFITGFALWYLIILLIVWIVGKLRRLKKIDKSSE